MISPKASTSCTTLEGVTLTVGSTQITTTSHLGNGDVGDPIYGTPIPTATTIVEVIGTSSARMSNPAMDSESDATLTMCPKGSGSITCTTVSGTLRFTPGLEATPLKIRVAESLTINGCTTSPPTTGGTRQIVPHVANFDAWTSKTPSLELDCEDFQTGSTFADNSVSTTGKVVWNTPKAKTTTFSFGGFAISAPQGTDTISFPNSGGAESTSGGYAGPASATLTSNPNLTLSGKCKTVAGVRLIQIQGGSVTFGH